MSRSPDHIETTSARLSLEDGVVRMEPRGVMSTAETVAETLDAITAAFGDELRPLLADARTWVGGDPASWMAFIQRAESMFTAVAVVLDSSPTPDLAQFSPFIDRLLIPFRMFTDTEAAMAFLASGRLLERLASLLERHETAAFQKLTRSHLALRAGRRYRGRRKGWPAGPASVKWEISG